MPFKTRKEIEEWYANSRNYIPFDRYRWAKEGECSRRCDNYVQIITYTVKDAEGNVIRTYTNDESHGAKMDNLTSFEEIISWIFNEGKENEWFVEKHRYEESDRTVFDPDLLNEKTEERRKNIDRWESESIKELEIKQAKNQRWRDACKWAKEHGVKYVSDRCNRFTTIRRNVIEAGLVEEWNAAWPEWSIGVDE